MKKEFDKLKEDFMVRDKKMRDNTESSLFSLNNEINNQKKINNDLLKKIETLNKVIESNEISYKEKIKELMEEKEKEKEEVIKEINEKNSEKISKIINEYELKMKLLIEKNENIVKEKDEEIRSMKEKEIRIKEEGEIKLKEKQEIISENIKEINFLKGSVEKINNNLVNMTGMKEEEEIKNKKLDEEIWNLQYNFDNFKKEKLKIIEDIEGFLFFILFFDYLIYLFRKI
jgi:hypothetical protein